jgi:DNA-binding transcriptional LysR family regulator
MGDRGRDLHQCRLCEADAARGRALRFRDMAAGLQERTMSSNAFTRPTAWAGSTGAMQVIGAPNGLGAPRLNVTTHSMQLRMQLLATGRYLTAVPASLWRYNAARWGLCALPVTLGKPLPVVIVTLKHRTLSPAAQLFVDQARAVSKDTTRSTDKASSQARNSRRNTA